MLAESGVIKQVEQVIWGVLALWQILKIFATRRKRDASKHARSAKFVHKGESEL